MLTRVILVYLLTTFAALAQVPAGSRSQMLQSLEVRGPQWGEISRQIWEFAEVGYKETRSAALLAGELKKAGFQVQEGYANIPTAFLATYGSGSPVIAILGEYDALPELSQESLPERKARVAGAPGHGCGHNLFGTASALAAITVKEWMQKNNIKGTLRFYGTPAEEGGGGKVYMGRAGAFGDVDAVLHWHPAAANSVTTETSMANINAKFRFHGVASHAASAPHRGRSALDGLLLMAHAVDMMREHVPPSTRIHYIFTKAGAAPNIVPAFAEGYFYARDADMTILDGVWERIIKCAQAGALGTETKMEMEIVNSVYNLLYNDPLARLVDRNLRAVGGVKYTPEERKFAEALQKTFDGGPSDPLGSEETVRPFGAGRGSIGGSTDVGDVSWLAPTGGFTAATYVPGTAGHSWQSAACAGMSIGRKGMMVAAKTLTLSAADLFVMPDVLKAAKADFQKRTAGHTYRSRVPANQGAPLRYRDNP
ncbi:MAG: amidohydrolase [Bryobacterales bacterium]|nr:amidohydrolase [Bryobacterales bacterium]